MSETAHSAALAGSTSRVTASAARLDLTAFVFVSWSNPQVELLFLELIAASPAVKECHHVTGTWNYLLKLRLANTHALEAFLADVARLVPGLQRTETIIVLSSAKDVPAADALP